MPVSTITRLPYQKIVFRQPLRAYESRLFRSAVLSVIRPYDVLYHNHLDDGVRMGYPLIQYKSLNGKAAILYLGEGIESIHALFTQEKRAVKVRGREINLEIDRMVSRLYRLRLLNDLLDYKIQNWMPLQDENFGRFRRMTSEDEKQEFLRKILTGNILAFAKGVDWFIDGELRVENFRVSAPRWISYKDVKFMSFDAHFSVNALLPPHIGLGKGAAHNYGVVYPKFENI